VPEPTVKSNPNEVSSIEPKWGAHSEGGWLYKECPLKCRTMRAAKSNYFLSWRRWG